VGGGGLEKSKRELEGGNLWWEDGLSDTPF